MINLELPKKIEDTRALLRQFSEGGLRPISRKYDLLEQKEMPEELYDLAADPGATVNRRGDQPDAYAGMGDPTGANGNLSLAPAYLDLTDPAPEPKDVISTRSPGVAMSSTAVRPIGEAPE